jgi:hypothetical protein
MALKADAESNSFAFSTAELSPWHWKTSAATVAMSLEKETVEAEVHSQSSVLYGGKALMRQAARLQAANQPIPRTQYRTCPHAGAPRLLMETEHLLNHRACLSCPYFRPCPFYFSYRSCSSCRHPRYHHCILGRNTGLLRTSDGATSSLGRKLGQERKWT